MLLCTASPATSVPVTGHHRYSLLMLLPSRLTQRLSKAMLCSSRELGFSTRILLMSSTPNCSSRASSEGHITFQHCTRTQLAGQGKAHSLHPAACFSFPRRAVHPQSHQVWTYQPN